jgi:hypothetical protein
LGNPRNCPIPVNLVWLLKVPGAVPPVLLDQSASSIKGESLAGELLPRLRL